MPSPSPLLGSPLIVCAVAGFLSALDALNLAHTSASLREGAAGEHRIGLCLNRARDATEALGRLSALPFARHFVAAVLHLLNFDAARHAVSLGTLGGGRLRARSQAGQRASS